MSESKYMLYKSQIRDLVLQGYGRVIIARTLGLSTNTVSKWLKKIREELDTEDFVLLDESGIRLNKKHQKLMDQNRILRKEAREEYRVYNVLEEYVRNLLEVFSGKSLSKLTIKHERNPEDKIGIVQLSDLHFNELVDLPHNKYDFKIASIRLKLLCVRAKQYFEANSIKKVVIAMTGDLLNSDRRLDELLSQATNRTKATFLAVDLLQQFILDLNQEFNLTVAYVVGNESRVGQELSFCTEGITDNYDTTIFHILSLLFKEASGVKFVKEDRAELPLKIGNSMFLLMHGIKAPANGLEKYMATTKGRFLARNIKIDYVLSGNIHSTQISDYYSRSASLVGSNDYNEVALNIAGKAAQNIYVVARDKTIDAIKIDLQVVEGVGYNIDKKLESYNTKSLNKTKENKTVFKIII